MLAFGICSVENGEQRLGAGSGEPDPDPDPDRQTQDQDRLFMSLHQLRETLELRFPDAMPIARGLAPAVGSGVAALDAVLPNRGLPRGCLTIWRGGAGASALLRGACTETVGRGERAAWVDGAGTTLGDFWPRGVMMVRPGRWGHALVGGAVTAARARARGARPGSGLDTSLNSRSVVFKALVAVEELLRSGGFALVVVTGVPSGMDAELVRLSRVAREGGGALVVVEQPRPQAGRAAPAVAAARLKVETWYRPEAHVWRRGVFGEPVEVESMGIGARVTGTGWLKHVNLQLPVLHHAHRLSLDPGLVDRRGVQPADLRRYERARTLERLAVEARGPAVEARGPAVEAIRLALGSGAAEADEQGVQSGWTGVESARGGGLAGAGEAGGGAAGGGAAAADRGEWTRVGGRAWAGRAAVRRAAVPAAG
jgi:hypothetical protein